MILQKEEEYNFLMEVTLPKKYFKSKLLSHGTNLLIITFYKTIIKSILKYASETWIMTKADIQCLYIFGLINDDNG